MMKKVFIGGHIYGKGLSKVLFVYDSIQKVNGEIIRTPIENGEILISEEEYSPEKYFLRVTDILYGQSEAWALEMARGYNFYEKNNDLSDEHEDPQNLYQAPREEQIFNVAVCEILGISRQDKFVSARRPPSYFSKVRKLHKDDLLGPLSQTTGDLKFAHIRSGESVIDFEAGIFKKNISKHTFITARTGGGKSNSMKVIEGKIMESNGDVASLIFEPHGEYIKDLKRHPYAAQQLIVYNQDGRDQDRKIRISYSRITIENLLNIKKQMKWSEPQERFMFEAQSLLKKNWFKTIVETPFDEAEYLAMNGGLQDASNGLETFVQNEFSKVRQETPIYLRNIFSNVHPDTVKATKSKLLRLARSPFLTATEEQDDMDLIMKYLIDGKVVLVDMASLSGLQELFLSSILAGEVLKRQKARYSKERDNFENGKYPPIAIVIEEAQRVLGKGEDSEGNIFSQIVNEGRKFLTGLIAITQQPKLMDPVVLSQMNTHIILGISDETDFDILKGRCQKPIHNLKLEISQLMAGEAIISSPDSPFAMPVKIFEYNQYIDKLKKKMPKRQDDTNRFASFLVD
ncbi:ATP-binding protein [Bacillus sp. Brlt_9]|uniref:ATP-binding protein n=1 Tax=Bacillus sp. Brlt_9 TaxID=3110916 RepID=UPI003F7BFF19